MEVHGVRFADPVGLRGSNPSAVLWEIRRMSAILDTWYDGGRGPSDDISVRRDGSDSIMLQRHIESNEHWKKSGTLCWQGK